MIPDPVYGDPTAPMWDLVLAVDEAGHDRGLVWSRKAVTDRRYAANSRRRHSARADALALTVIEGAA